MPLTPGNVCGLHCVACTCRCQAPALERVRGMQRPRPAPHFSTHSCSLTWTAPAMCGGLTHGCCVTSMVTSPTCLQVGAGAGYLGLGQGTAGRGPGAASYALRPCSFQPCPDAKAICAVRMLCMCPAHAGHPSFLTCMLGPLSHLQVTTATGCALSCCSTSHATTPTPTGASTCTSGPPRPAPSMCPAWLCWRPR